MITIRSAELTDKEPLFRLARAFATSFAVDLSAFESMFPEIVRAENAFLAVAVHEDRLIGYVLGFDHSTFLVKPIWVTSEYSTIGIAV
jgi:hypothetical protein